MIATASRKSPWLPRAENQAAAPLRLFVLPFAGGGVAQFQAFCRAAPDWLDVQPVQLPGRENRMFEPPVGNLAELVEILQSEVAPHLDRPYALLGYSMGSRVSLELVHALAAAGRPLPLQLIVAAHAAPALPSRIPRIESLDSETFWDLIAGYEGTPEEVLCNDELKMLVEPTLRADFSIARQAVTRTSAPLDLPILAIAGRHDTYAGPGDMQPWKNETSGSFHLQIVDGGHFFLHSHPHAFSSCVFEALKPLSERHGLGN
ncbi:thioesterase II family protein [Roseibium marinum]|uniref:thioesterase II family protein n=1 Tax=Roseibium marinum TaxID=281252 RepID=UPI001472FF98|nr:thioesterase [Roseibium marinum]